MSKEYGYEFTDEEVSLLVFDLLEEIGKKHLKNVDFFVDIDVDICIDYKKDPDARLHVHDLLAEVEQFLDFGRFRPPRASNPTPHEINDDVYKCVSILFCRVLLKISKKHLKKMTDFAADVFVRFDFDYKKYSLSSGQWRKFGADVDQFLKPDMDWLRRQTRKEIRRRRRSVSQAAHGLATATSARQSGRKMSRTSRITTN
jgi:hypothetical protein